MRLAVALAPPAARRSTPRPRDPRHRPPGAEPLSQRVGKYAMDQAVLDKYAALRDKIQAEYVFIDADCSWRSSAARSTPRA